MARRESIVVEQGERWTVLLIVAIGLALRVGFAVTLPPFQAPDERAHFDYVRSLVEDRALPIQPHLTPSQALAGWPQSYQPPLAYLAFVPVAAASRALDARAVTTLRALRIQNAMLGAALVAVAFAGAVRIGPAGDPLRVLGPALVALLPGLVSSSASLNNDTLANLLAASLWLVWLGAPAGGRRSAGLGLLFGAACLTKLTAASLAPLLLLVPWLQTRQASSALREAAAAGALALLVLLPWMLRNLSVYGDPLALDAGSFSFAELEGSLPSEVFEAAASPAPGKALLQIFGRFGITNNLSHWIVPAAWLPLSAVGLAGLFRSRPQRAARDATPRWIACAVAAVALAALGLVSFSLRYYGAWQGRYLYISAVPLLLLLAEGVARWLPEPPRRAWIAALVLALLSVCLLLLWELSAFFADTPRALWGQRTHL